jgi:hypothetical protein
MRGAYIHFAVVLAFRMARTGWAETTGGGVGLRVSLTVGEAGGRRRH